MNKRDWYFHQPVTEAEMDSAFNDVEAADWNQMKDLGAFGILSGGTVSAPGSWNIAVQPFAAIDRQGRRLNASGVITQSVQTATDGTNCLPASGLWRWVGVFARFGRDVSDSRTDGLGNPIKFQQNEALNPDDVQADVGKLLVVAGGTSSNSGALPTLVADQADAVRICDVLISSVDSAVAANRIYTGHANRFALNFRWSHQKNVEAGLSATKKYHKIMSAPTFKGDLTPRYTRWYAGSAGMVITHNASWDSYTGFWTADDLTVPAAKFTFDTNGITMERRADTSVTWTDTDDGSGWDGLGQFGVNTTNGQMAVLSGSDFATSGPSAAMWGWEGSMSGALLAGSAVTFHHAFTGVPSSVTLSTVGGAPADLNVASVAINTSCTTSHGTLVEINGVSGGQTNAYRKVSASL